MSSKSSSSKSKSRSVSFRQAIVVLVILSFVSAASVIVASVSLASNQQLQSQLNQLQWQQSSSVTQATISAIQSTINGQPIPNLIVTASPPNVLQSPDYWVFDFNAPHSTDLITANGYAKAANVENFPAVHGQAFSQTLFQLEVNGSNAPHHHPDAVEILFVFEGTIEAFRVEPNNGHTYQQTLSANMSVIFPRNHVHFQRNIGTGIARYISSLNAELPGVYTEALRTCLLPHDELSSLFSQQSTAAIDDLCSRVQPNPAKFLF